MTGPRRSSSEVPARPKLQIDRFAEPEQATAYMNGSE
jgi:hypothetical protein